MLQVDEVLSAIHRFDPPGVASRDLKECLLAQIKTRRVGMNGLTERIVKDYLPDLGRKKYADIARGLKIPVDQVKAIAKEIGTLEPRPARRFSPVPPIFTSSRISSSARQKTMPTTS